MANLSILAPIASNGGLYSPKPFGQGIEKARDFKSIVP